MSMRWQAAIVKPGFNPLGTQTTVTTYTYYLYSWGQGDYGESGLGNITKYSSPKQVGSLTDWAKLSGGWNNNIAIKTDGTLWGWGSGRYGALGLGNTTYYSSPKQIGSLTNWSQISNSGGNYFCLAVKTDGSLWFWGYGANGQN